MFCPKCHTLMFPKNGQFVCGNEGCGYQREVTSEDREVSSVTNPAKSRPMETLVIDSVQETIPKTKIDCPKCGHKEAFWIMRQTRAADEPTTRILRCTKCGYTWREY